MTPLEHIQAITDAYSLSIGCALPGSYSDIVFATDIDGIERPYALATGSTVDFRGTENLPGWIQDLMIAHVSSGSVILSAGLNRVFHSLRTLTGRPMESFAGFEWGGHSFGADLAAVCAAEFGGKFELFAPSRLVGGSITSALADPAGHAYAVNGDWVPHLPIDFPEIPNLVRLRSSSAWGPVECHELTTYQGCIAALL